MHTKLTMVLWTKIIYTDLSKIRANVNLVKTLMTDIHS